MSQPETFSIDAFDPTELRQSYIDNGYVIVKETMTASEREELDTELKKFNRGDYGSFNGIEPVDWELDDERLLARYTYAGQTHAVSKVISRYVTHPGLVSVLDHIVGANVPFWDGGYNCVQTMFVSKEPYGTGSPWHQDEHPIPTRDRSLTGVWIPTSDVTVDNGCLWIIPDSHKSGTIWDRHDHNKPDIDSHKEAQGFDDSRAIPVELEAGSALFFSGYLLHSARKNTTNAYRPTFTLHYTSSTTLLTWRGERNYRGVVPIKGIDPYADEGYVTPSPWVHIEKDD